MSNLMIALLTVFAFAAGLGLGLVLVMRPKPTPVVMSAKDYKNTFMREDKDDDHPHDIERQGSRFAQRDAEHRYDGMADGEAPHVPVGARGLDFGSTPR